MRLITRKYGITARFVPRPYSQLSSVAQLGIVPGDEATCIVELYNATRLLAPYITILRKSSKRSSRSYVCVATPTHVTRGRKTLQTYGFTIQTYGKYHNFNSDVNQQSPHTSNILHACIKIVAPSVPKSPTNHFFFFFCNMGPTY